jgi:hypothetical protein
MTTAIKADHFRRAIRVRRNDQGQYSFLATWDKPFSDVIIYDGQLYKHKIVETLTGWGEWTHCIAVIMGDERIHYFAR